MPNCAQVAQLNAAMSRSMDGCVYHVEGAGFVRNGAGIPTTGIDIFVQPGRGVALLTLGLPERLTIDGETQRVKPIDFSERAAMQAIGDQLDQLRQQRVAGARDVGAKIASLGRSAALLLAPSDGVSANSSTAQPYDNSESKPECSPPRTP